MGYIPGLHIFFGGSLVTLAVAFGFLPQHFGTWWGPTNGTLSINTGSVVEIL